MYIGMGNRLCTSVFGVHVMVMLCARPQRDYDKAEQECQKYRTLLEEAREEVKDILVSEPGHEEE